ncbi:DUF6440 family protein [Azospirillum sp. B4]|uniref:DUF6440 family protein n=1 Tax=Azospirillum sp. B4 TaxID=95605 RepID=UPI0005CAB1A4|nr:DUF6440 family protein [Azospirillum sp. B4]
MKRTIIAAALLLAACDVQRPGGTHADPVPWASVRTDAETGCQYLTGQGNNHDQWSITPRLGRDGRPMCGTSTAVTMLEARRPALLAADPIVTWGGVE